jgi:hypothetical protein
MERFFFLLFCCRRHSPAAYRHRHARPTWASGVGTVIADWLFLQRRGQDGSFNGQPMGTATLVYVTEGTDIAGKRVFRKGTVTVTR